ncbi:MAG: YidC/Oxa1 family membrane protein insertase, partial [bacterium]|nr:YidC/Oxa1 family membrane protein insertase [bacterium]
MESIFDILYIPMGYILRFAYSFTHNYLFAIFLFTLVMEILLSPIAIKQQKNQIKQARLAPKVAAIRKKYAGRNDQATQQRMQQETMEMYQSENFNPMGGCLPLL